MILCIEHFINYIKDNSDNVIDISKFIYGKCERCDKGSNYKVILNTDKEFIMLMPYFTINNSMIFCKIEKSNFFDNPINHFRTTHSNLYYGLLGNVYA
jgi:hypothetical protein